MSWWRRSLTHLHLEHHMLLYTCLDHRYRPQSCQRLAPQLVFWLLSLAPSSPLLFSYLELRWLRLLRLWYCKCGIWSQDFGLDAGYALRPYASEGLRSAFFSITHHGHLARSRDSQLQGQVDLILPPGSSLYFGSWPRSCCSWRALRSPLRHLGQSPQISIGTWCFRRPFHQLGLRPACRAGLHGGYHSEAWVGLRGRHQGASGVQLH